MAELKSTQDSRDPTMPPPEVEGLLPDVPGGETNLVPEALTHADLKVWFTVPVNSDPAAAKERVELFVDNNANPISYREWTRPIEDSDRYLELPQQWLRNNDGEHRLRYKATIYNGEVADSYDLVTTLDTRAPVLATDSTLIFPPEIVPPPKQLTARYLEQTTPPDQVQASLPAYTPPRPGDRITWYWSPDRGGMQEGGVIVLNDQSYSRPIVITVLGDLIRGRGDGMRYVRYKIEDRAGNVSVDSAVVDLDIAATPIPRTLPWPSVEKAAGSGAQQTLDPLQVTTDAIAVIPDDAVIYPSDQVWLQWGEPGTLGACRVDTPIFPGQRRYAVPRTSVAAYIGKDLPVYYHVIDQNSKEWPSQRLSLKIIKLSGLPTMQCDGLTGGNLSYRNVETAGAKLTLIPWPLMTTDHWIRITMTGVSGGSGGEVAYPVINRRAVTDREILSGIGVNGDVRVPKTFLNSLRRNAPLTGRVYVSFDGGQTWPPEVAPEFPLLQLALVVWARGPGSSIVSTGQMSRRPLQRRQSERLDQALFTRNFSGEMARTYAEFSADVVEVIINIGLAAIHDHGDFP